ncbi:MAG TPA: glycine--tRNA ligase subunit beta, partial [Thermoanaerobaculia bacterium]|nr:glycine--tRNA ligase subunit beta [Thermoanaerobaculia bacterium]
MSSADLAEFFLEVRVEEMPAGAIPGAKADLARKFTDALAEEGLPSRSVGATATPRRLVVSIRGLPRRQEDRTVE